MSANATVPESAAITALGSLFRITEVFLWDDETVSRTPAEEPTSSYSTSDVSSSFEHSMEDYTSVEDFELAQQMDALGLPISFSTTKEKKNMTTKGKRKSKQTKSLSVDRNIENRVPDVSRVAQLEDNALLRVLHDSTTMHTCNKTAEGESGASYPEVYGGHCGYDAHSDVDSISLDVTVFSTISKKHVGSEVTDVITSNDAKKECPPDNNNMEKVAEVLEQPTSLDVENLTSNVLEDAVSGVQQEGLFNKMVQYSSLEGASVACHIADVENDPCSTSMESSLSCASVDHPVADHPDITTGCKFGDWRVVWDSFYKRNFFYNFLSQESTWYPPPGLEQFAFSGDISDSNVMPMDVVEEDASIGFACDAIKDIELQDLHGKTSLETGNDFDYLSQSSEVTLSRMSNDLTSNFGVEHSDRHGEAVAYDQVSLHFSDVDHHAADSNTDIPDATEILEKQEKNVTSLESCSVPDVPLNHLISNSLAVRLEEEVDYDENRMDSQETCTTSTMNELALDSQCEIPIKNKKKRVRRHQSQHTLRGVKEGLPVYIAKYWCRRYSLFSHFDNGIKMDEEGWFSVTPELIARHHARRCGSGTVVDCFTGVGGNAIQFAMKSNHVIAIDIDPRKIEYAQNNAAIYGVHDRVDFIEGDFFHIAPHLKGDVVFMSPPWGGPDYNQVQTYDLGSMLKPRDGHYLFNIARLIASKVVMFLPRNVDLSQLAELALSVSPPWSLEVEKNFLNGRLKAITAYFENTAT